MFFYQKSLVVFCIFFVAAKCRNDIELNEISSQNNIDELRLRLILGDGMSKSTEMAFQSCQNEFNWDRWNCPHSDFLNKRYTNKLDREAAFVQTTTFAASIFYILTICSNGKPKPLKNQIFNCIDPVEFNGKLMGNFLQLHKQTRFDILTYAKKHNERAAWIAVRELMRKNCGCNDLFNSCVGQECTLTPSNFSSIASEIRKMYDRSILLTYDNHGQINSKVREDALVFTYDSPNYCKENVIPGWQGMVGRQCSRNKGFGVDMHERRSCHNLCRSCGLRVRRQQVHHSYRCNCKFEWCCSVTCDICHEYREQHYCY